MHWIEREKKRLGVHNISGYYIVKVYWYLKSWSNVSNYADIKHKVEFRLKNQA